MIFVILRIELFRREPVNRADAGFRSRDFMGKNLWLELE
jgi:hypothetical protein